MPRNKSNTLLERAEKIFKFIEFYAEPVPKYKFKSQGLSTHAMDNWIKLIQFIQSMPILVTREQGRKLLVDTLDNPHMLMMRKRYFNPNLSYEQREQAILLYLQTLITQEKLKGDPVDIDAIIRQYWQSQKPKVKRMIEEIDKELEQIKYK